MVEVEHERLAFDLAHHAGEAGLAVGRRKAHHVTDSVFGVDIAVFGKQRAADALQEIRTAIAEGLARGQVELSAAAFGQAEQARRHGRRKLPAAERERGRPRAEGIDERGAVGAAQSIVEGQEGPGLNAVQGLGFRGIDCNDFTSRRLAPLPA